MKSRLLYMGVAITMTVICEFQSANCDQFSKVQKEIRDILINSYQIINSSEQAIIIINSVENPEYVKLFSVEKKDGIWRHKFSEVRATIGKNGFADIGMKKEGDGKTPSGVFKLGLAFGYEKSIDTKIPYRQSTENDFWIDDVGSEKYN